MQTYPPTTSNSYDYASARDARLLDDIHEMARQATREQLSLSASFSAMPVTEQQALYRHVMKENVDKLAQRHGVARQMAASQGPGSGMGFGGYDPGFQGSTQAFNELVDSVDFPKFVADLLKAVFDANIKVMKAQTDDYIRLMKEATKSTADFIKKISDEDSFAYLVENNSNEFGLVMETDADGAQKLALGTPEGEKVDTDDSAVKAKILDAKMAMAKEHRAALREVILMGVTRLVVEKGEVEAGVEFKITANRESKTSHKDQNINTVSASGSFGGFFAKGSFSASNTNIQINTSDKKATDDLSAKLMGKVNIKFKTDYFKLDNFAAMYADGGVAALKQGAAGGGAAPAGGAALPAPPAR
jgi:hypothetical protein